MKQFSPSRDWRAGRRTSRQRIANQLRAIPQSVLQKKIRDFTEEETAERELATDEARGRVEPPPKWQQLNPGEEKGHLTPRVWCE